MEYAEEALIDILHKAGVSFTASLPCEKIKNLLEMVDETFFHVPLTREEEGVGICAGAALAGRLPALFVQSSGIGNMINALLSLTRFYELPLAIFVSQRGIHKEKIAAQIPMGQKLPGILRGAGIPHSSVSTRDHFRDMGKKLIDLYKRSRIHVFLLSPALWEDREYGVKAVYGLKAVKKKTRQGSYSLSPVPSPRYTRSEILRIIAPHLDSKVVVCNLGFPSKELFSIRHQPSNFYMLGSMGMATPLGLGISLAAEGKVFVIDGDGSLLMNPGTLATAAHCAPENLTICAIDNGVYGSTGSQPTLTGSCVDLELVARGFGIGDTIKAAGQKQLIDAVKGPGKGLRFIHALAVPGNEAVRDIPLHHLEIKRQVQEFIKGRLANVRANL